MIRFCSAEKRNGAYEFGDTDDVRSSSVNTTAIVMMVLSLVTLWGGLVASAIHLHRNPDEPE